MATLPAEQVTQRNKIGDVSIVYDYHDDSPGEKIWLSTTTLPYTVVNTKATAVNQQDRDVLEARIVAAGEAAYTDYDIYTEEGYGYNSNSQPLVIVGDGTETLAVSVSTTATKDIAPYVTGGYEPLTYTIDAAAEDDFGTSTMIGSVLQYVAGAGAGADTVPVMVTDTDDNTVTITVTVTVS